MEWFIYILNGLYYASTIFLISLGLNIILGVMGILNLAHGSLYAIGAFTAAWLITSLAGWNSPDVLSFIILLGGAILAGFVGLLLERTLISPLYNRALEYQLLITFGALLLFEDLIKIVWGGEAYYASKPFDILGKVDLSGNIYPIYFLLVIVIAIVVKLLTWLFLARTRVGIMLRAMSLDIEMATALGLQINRLRTWAFVLGAALAGLAGALVAPTTPVLLGFGMEPLILAFVVVVIGGLGSLKGAFIGSLIVGEIRSFGIVIFPEIELAILYLIAAIILVIKPEGLFGRIKS
ncbi:branched-chain amino acid ABC transporter permease [Desulfobacterota bacterium AH_259_B03_O07]|nr:branched-chain amino acid ABC transporter permease [Desulfobacterota bacterium AH_259_B03_O07]